MFCTLVRGQHGALVTIALVDDFTPRVGEDRDRTGVDPVRYLEFAHELQYVAGALDVDTFCEGLVLADPVPGCSVEHAIAASHGLAQALSVHDVAFEDFHTQSLEVFGLGAGANKGSYVMARGAEFLGEAAANEARGARHKVSHPRRLSARGREWRAVDVAEGSRPGARLEAYSEALWA